MEVTYGKEGRWRRVCEGGVGVDWGVVVCLFWCVVCLLLLLFVCVFVCCLCVGYVIVCV